MIAVFFKSGAQVQMSQSLAAFAELTPAAVLWIDLLDPSGEEKKAAEAFLGTDIQSRAQAEEIESSSRYYESDKAIFANMGFVNPGPDEYSVETVSFILKDNVLTTIRESPLRSFTELQNRIRALPKSYPSGFSVFLRIMEQRIDLDADTIELMSKDISQYNHNISLGEDINEELLLDINQLQENTMIVRESVVDKQRVISSILKSPKCPKGTQNKLNILLKDISSLINHTNFSFERMEYLQNTVIGLINLDQNRIMKVFTLVSLLLMPPTLIASFFGMNVNFGGIVANSLWVWAAIAGLMVLSFLVILFVFKKRKML